MQEKKVNGRSKFVWPAKKKNEDNNNNNNNNSNNNNNKIVDYNFYLFRALLDL